MNLSDRDRPTCTSEAGLVAAPPIAPRSPSAHHDRQIDQNWSVARAKIGQFLARL
jgi:hypothetical protein